MEQADAVNVDVIADRLAGMGQEGVPAVQDLTGAGPTAPDLPATGTGPDPVPPTGMGAGADQRTDASSSCPQDNELPCDGVPTGTVTDAVADPAMNRPAEPEADVHADIPMGVMDTMGVAAAVSDMAAVPQDGGFQACIGPDAPCPAHCRNSCRNIYRGTAYRSDGRYIRWASC